MKKTSKRYQSIADCDERLNIEDAVSRLKEQPSPKFDESIDVSVNLNLEKKHTVRDAFSFPNGFGKSKRVLVFAKDDKAEEAKSVGADFVGGADMIEKIQGGWLDFDVVIATPDMMKEVAKVARVLGSRGMMPNPKAKTVSDDVVGTINEVKAGRKEFRANAEGVLNFSIGKKSMDAKAIVENAKAFMDMVLKKKPNDLKGDYIRSVYISSTMGKGIELDRKLILK